MKSRLLVIMAFVSLALAASAAKPVKSAKSVKTAKTTKSAAPMESAFRRTPYVGAASMDVATGQILFSDHADQKAYPASVTKLMTALLVLEDVAARRYTLQTLVTATPEIYRSEPSWVGLKVGEQMTVGDLLTALMVESANDAAIALAVNSAGSMAAFVAKMNARAKSLGMNSTGYYNPNGLPPNNAKRYPWTNFNFTTANDQLKLARALLTAPKGRVPPILAFTSVKTCDLIKTANGYRVFVTRRTNGGAAASTVLAAGEKVIKAMKNHNNVMRTDKLKVLNPDGTEAVDGLKTGYINAGGSSMILTGARNGKRVAVVVLGSATSKDRDANARRLFSDALEAMSW